MRLSRLLLSSLLTVVLGTASCGTKSSSTGYEIAFPSIAAAVAVDTVQVLVFDTSDCTTLVESRRSGQPLPPTILAGPPTSPCSLASGGGSLSVSNGNRALLAIAQYPDPVTHQDKDFLIGCVVQNIADGSAVVPIRLTLINQTVAVPPTTCMTLSQHCSKQC
jgi:hypothetical protein